MVPFSLLNPYPSLESLRVKSPRATRRQEVRRALRAVLRSDASRPRSWSEKPEKTSSVRRPRAWTRPWRAEERSRARSFAPRSYASRPRSWSEERKHEIKREGETRKSGTDVRSPSVPIFMRRGERTRRRTGYGVWGLVKTRRTEETFTVRRPPFSEKSMKS